MPMKRFASSMDSGIDNGFGAVTTSLDWIHSLRSPSCSKRKIDPAGAPPQGPYMKSCSQRYRCLLETNCLAGHTAHTHLLPSQHSTERSGLAYRLSEQLNHRRVRS